MSLIRTAYLLMLLACGICRAAEPTFGDLAVVMAKGYFKNQVPADARLEQCVLFLNRNGVRFSVFDLVDPDKTVSKEDVARGVGQAALLFLGEAEIVNGSIKKPLGAETWVDYCLLNDVNFASIWVELRRVTEGGSLPEVRLFFHRASGGR